MRKREVQVTIYTVEETQEVGGAGTSYSLKGGDLLWIAPGAALLNNSAVDDTITFDAVEGEVVTVIVDGLIYSRDDNCISDWSLSGGGSLNLSVSATGAVTAVKWSAIFLDDGDHRISNAGLISTVEGDQTIYSEGLVELINSGRLEGGGAGAAVRTVNLSLENSGEITGTVFATGDAAVSNTGQMSGLNLTYAQIRNYEVLGFAVFESGSLTNSGVIQRGVNITSSADGEAALVNAGEILSSGIAILGGAGSERLLNTGVIGGDVYLGSGNDRCDTREGVLSGQILGLSGSDTLLGTRSGDWMDAGTGRDLVRGFEGDDELAGGRDGDRVWGGDGDDSLSGDSGADSLTGGRGDDMLAGGAGADLFVFAGSFGHDEITEFDVGGGDLIRLSRALFRNFSDLDAHMQQAGPDVVIVADDGSTLILRGVTEGALTASDFVFG
jgi:Ca2+-binding RTX toxin-like protein